MRRSALPVRGEAAGRRDPSGMTAHHLEDEDLGRRERHRRDVERRLANRDRNVLRHRAEAGAVVGDRQIVVDGLRDADRDDRITEGFAELRDLERGIRRIPPAVVEEVPDVVGAEDIDEPLVLRAVLVEPPELVAAGAERARRRMLESGDRLRALPAGVDEIFGQGADDAVASGEHLAHPIRVHPCRLDHSGRGRVDDCGDAARLGIERVLGHRPALRLDGITDHATIHPPVRHGSEPDTSEVVNSINMDHPQARRSIH